MNILISFIVKHYTYFIFGAILLFLALIGYIIDTGREKRVRKEKAKYVEETINIPYTGMNANVRLGGSNPSQNNGVPPVQPR